MDHASQSCNHISENRPWLSRRRNLVQNRL